MPVFGLLGPREVFLGGFQSKQIEVYLEEILNLLLIYHALSSVLILVTLLICHISRAVVELFGRYRQAANLELSILLPMRLLLLTSLG